MKKLQSAAIVTIKQASDMTPKGRQEVAKWLRKQAGFIVKYGKELAPVFRARYLYLVLLLIAIPELAFAQLGTNMYTATTGSGKTTAAGCVYVSFTGSGFTGTIGNASFSNIAFSIPVPSAYQSGAGQRLNPIPYVVTSGTLVITEVK